MRSVSRLGTDGPAMRGVCTKLQRRIEARNGDTVNFDRVRSKQLDNQRGEG